jgi:hypothetical protein
MHFENNERQHNSNSDRGTDVPKTNQNRPHGADYRRVQDKSIGRKPTNTAASLGTQNHVDNELITTLNHFVKNHYNVKRAEKCKELQFVVNDKGFQKKLRDMTANEIIHVVDTQFGHGDEKEEILNLLHDIKSKDKNGGNCPSVMQRKWCSGKAKELCNLISEFLGLCGSWYANKNRGKYSEIHGPSHAIGTLLITQWLANELENNGRTVTRQDALVAGLAAIGHDSGRQTEGKDVDEHRSAWNMRNYLSGTRNMGNYAKTVYDTILGKDDQTRTNSKSMAKILVHDADCLEIIRCLRKEKKFDINSLDILRLKLVSIEVAQSIVEKAQLFIKIRGNDRQEAYTMHYTKRDYDINKRFCDINTKAAECGIVW